MSLVGSASGTSSTSRDHEQHKQHCTEQHLTSSVRLSPMLYPAFFSQSQCMHLESSAHPYWHSHAWQQCRKLLVWSSRAASPKPCACMPGKITSDAQQPAVSMVSACLSVHDCSQAELWQRGRPSARGGASSWACRQQLTRPLQRLSPQRRPLRAPPLQLQAP